MIRTVFNACLASICALLFTLQASAVVRELDRIVAVVEDDVVLGSELITRLTTVREQMEAADITPPPNEVLLNQILVLLWLLNQIRCAKVSGIGIVVRCNLSFSWANFKIKQSTSPRATERTDTLFVRDIVDNKQRKLLFKQLFLHCILR